MSSTETEEEEEFDWAEVERLLSLLQNLSGTSSSDDNDDDE